MTTMSVQEKFQATDQAQVARQFRQALGAFPTGVALVTAATADGPVGMTVNSFASVSLDPMLVLFCPAKKSKTWAAMKSVTTCTISILSAAQEPMSRAFASPVEDRFAGFEWATTAEGHPRPIGAVAWFEVSIASIDKSNAGDHDLVICAVTNWGHAATNESLIFHKGKYSIPAENGNSEIA